MVMVRDKESGVWKLGFIPSLFGSIGMIRRPKTKRQKMKNIPPSGDPFLQILVALVLYSRFVMMESKNIARTQKETKSKREYKGHVCINGCFNLSKDSNAIRTSIEVGVF